MLTKIFETVKKYQSDIILAVCVCLLTLTAYNIGKNVAYDSLKTPLSIINPGGEGDIVRPDGSNMTANVSSSKTDLSVVASSKSSGKLYHFKWCPGAGQISQANLLIFPTESAAISAGYKLASNCQR